MINYLFYFQDGKIESFLVQNGGKEGPSEEEFIKVGLPYTGSQ